MYRLKCTQQWRPKSTNFGHTKKFWDLEHNLSYRWGLTGCFRDMHTTSHSQSSYLTSANGRMGSTQTKKGTWLRSKTNKGTGTGVYWWGLRRGHSFSLGLHTTVFQDGIYAIKSCIMENTEKGYRGRNIYILSNIQAVIKTSDSFQINSTLSPECDTCKQVSETASHVLCDYEDLATLWIRHLGHHLMKPSDFNLSARYCTSSRCRAAKWMS